MAAVIVLAPCLAVSGFTAHKTPAGKENHASDLAYSLSGLAQFQAPPTAKPARESYWHHLAVKRLRFWRYSEKRIVRLRLLVKRLRASDHRRNGVADAPLTATRNGSPGSDVRSVICEVFGAACSAAIAVARCESTLNVYARNGDYWGLFQFGSYARRAYGFAWNAWAQARGAYHYWLHGGWSHWTCQP